MVAEEGRDCISSFNVNGERLAENTKVIMVACEYTYQDNEYIIRTVNTKMNRCGMAFLLQPGCSRLS